MGIRTNKIIKLIIGRPDVIFINNLLKKKIRRRAVLIGSPVHSNLGDHLIADNCLRFIKDLGFDMIVDIPEFYYELFSESIVLDLQDVIFVVGGGWLGNDYDDSDIICQIIKKWPNNKIVILPQTVHFSNEGKYGNVDTVGEIFASSENVLLCVREKRSFTVATEILRIPNNRVLLSPDITLYKSEYLDLNQEKSGAVLSIRNDREVIQDDLDSTIKNVLKDLNINYKESSTVVKNKIVPLIFRKRFIRNKTTEYGKAELVITNRLHSMIFAVLGRSKCIAFDNSTHKVSETVLNWFADNPNIRYLSNPNLATLRDTIREFYNVKYVNYEFGKEYSFNDLSKKIGEFIDEG